MIFDKASFDITQQIVFEDDHILVVNKPHGLMVEPDRNNHPNLLNYVKDYLRKTHISKNEIYAQHIHRLDRPVGGLVLFTKNKEVLRNLSEQFAERRVTKSYVALSENFPEHMSGSLENWHRKEKKKAVIVDQDTSYSEFIKLDYQTTKTEEGKCLWQIKLHTGKFHQIRIQLAHVGCPIIGDITYGAEISFYENAIALFSNQLTILHPITNQKIEFTAHAIFQ